MESEIRNDSRIAIVYDEKFKNWDEDPNFNYRYLKEVQDTWNLIKNIVREDHTVYLNEILDCMDCERDQFDNNFESKVGWHGNAIIDFGLFDDENIEFVKGKTPIATLLFNTNMINPSNNEED